MDLFAKPPLGADAHAVADDQHTHHQLGVDRGSTHLAVERLQRSAEIGEVQVAVDAPIVPLLWGRARPSSEGGMGGSDRGAHLDNVGPSIFARRSCPTD